MLNYSKYYVKSLWRRFTLKLRVGSKNKFDKWKQEAFREVWSDKYGEDVIRLIDIEKLIKLIDKPFDDDIREIDVLPEMTVRDVIVLLTGQEPWHQEPQHQEPQHEDFSEFPMWREEARKITESYLYCLSASSKKLDPSMPLSAYDIQNDDLLLLGVYTKIEPDSRTYRALLIRDVDDFCRIVRSCEDIKESPGLLFQPYPIPKAATQSLATSIMVGSMFHAPGLRPVECVLLYTDADFSIAEYIRCHFAELDEMTGHHLNIYTIEEPTSVQGVSAKLYWQARIEKSKYDFLHLMGWTQSKPYDKNHSHRIARLFGLYPDSLPCVVFFEDIKGTEKVVVTIPRIQTDQTDFFRKLSSVALKTCEKIVQSELKNQFSFSDFKNEFMEIWEAEKNNKQDKNFVFHGKTVIINGRIEQMTNIESQMNFYSPVTGATGKNEGTININTLNQNPTLAEAVKEIEHHLKQLEEKNPNATESEQVDYVNLSTNSDIKKRAVAALKAGGETAVDEFVLENKYLKVGKAIIKGWLQPNS